MANTAQLNALKTAIVTFAGKIKQLSETALYADNAGQLEGLTLAQVVEMISGSTETTVREVELALQAFIARTDNPHQVTKAQVGLGSLENFGIATNVQALDQAISNAYMTPQRTWEALLHFWSTKVGSTPETLDTIEELAAALQNNPDIIQALQDQVANKATRVELTNAVGLIDTRFDALEAFIDETYVTKTMYQQYVTTTDAAIAANQQAITTLQGTVATKASQQALDTLTGVVATKASIDSVNALSLRVDTKAEEEDLIAAIASLETAFAEAIAALEQ